MPFTYRQQRSLKQGVVIVLLGVLAGFLYAAEVGDLGVRHAIFNSLFIGFSLGLVLAIGELVLFRRQKRRVRFVVLFVTRSALYLIAVFLITFNVFVISRMRRFEMGFVDVVRSDEFRLFMNDEYHVILFYCLLIMITVNFTGQMNRKLGPGMLWAYISGKYKFPVRQEQVIMFVDLVGSREIIRRLGATAYHNFLNDVIYDITEPIVSHAGRIVHYVDDEVVVSWSLRDGRANANCVRTYFDMRSRLYSLNEKYHATYGFLPGVRAAIHAGTLIRAEVGSVKTEVCAVGDVMNTTSRILDLAICNDVDLVVSDVIQKSTVLPVLYKYKSMGVNKMRGKLNKIEVFTIQSETDVLGR